MARVMSWCKDPEREERGRDKSLKEHSSLELKMPGFRRGIFDAKGSSGLAVVVPTLVRFVSIDLRKWGLLWGPFETQRKSRPKQRMVLLNYEKKLKEKRKKNEEERENRNRNVRKTKKQKCPQNRPKLMKKLAKRWAKMRMTLNTRVLSHHKKTPRLY